MPCRFFGFLSLRKKKYQLCRLEMGRGAYTLDRESNGCAQGNGEEDRCCGVREYHCWQGDRGDIGRHYCGPVLIDLLELKLCVLKLMRQLRFNDLRQVGHCKGSWWKGGAHLELPHLDDVAS